MLLDCYFRILQCAVTTIAFQQVKVLCTQFCWSLSSPLCGCVLGYVPGWLLWTEST